MESEGTQYQSSLARHFAPAISELRHNCAQNSGLAAVITALLLEIFIRLFLSIDRLAHLWESGLLPLPTPRPTSVTPRPRARSPRARIQV